MSHLLLLCITLFLNNSFVTQIFYKKYQLIILEYSYMPRPNPVKSNLIKQEVKSSCVKTEEATPY